MITLFDTPPPRFLDDEIVKILLIDFNLIGDVNSLVSDRDQNFLIQSDNGSKYILKISNPAEEREILEMQNEATLFIRSKDSNLGVPLQIGEIKTIEKNGQSYFVRLLEYLDGQFLKDQILDDDTYEKLGEFLGRLNRNLNGFSHSAADRDFHWDSRALNLIHSRLQYLDEKSDEKTILHFLNQYKRHVSPHESQLRKMVIHNDGNDHNVVVNKNGETIGIIDFGDMVYSYQVAEPAVCMAYVGLGKSDPYRSMGQVLKGYHSKFSLNDAEIRSAIYLTCIRLCISVTMAAWRMKLYPENSYLAVSQDQAWELLRRMENEDLSIKSEEMVMNAQ